MGQSNESETPSLPQVLRDAIDDRLVDLNTMMPGEIATYDGKKADVRPHFIRQLTNGEEEVLPVIKNVPVVFPRTARAGIRLPVNVGDKGAIIFSQRSLDTWKSRGEQINPNDPRKHDLTDAVFFPGLYDLNDNLDFDKSKMDMVNDKALIELSEDGTIQIKSDTFVFKMTPSGKFSFDNGGAIEFVALLDRILDNLIALKVITGIGPQGLFPASAALLQQDKTDLAGFKE